MSIFFPISRNRVAVQAFLDNATNGVVYVSLGSIKRLPAVQQAAIIGALSQLKQHVLWDSAEPIDDLPANICCEPELQHVPVLAHKNVVLFVTHGDTIIVKQALHNGIPMLIIPLHSNQVGEISPLWLYNAKSQEHSHK